MSGAMSLEKSVRTCDVNVGEAPRIQSDRFENPQNMVCIPWNGLDNLGREVCFDSFYTKTPGCDSAEDRVMVENSLRPQYANYVTLGAQGIAGNIYADPNSADYRNSLTRTAFDASRRTGVPGTGFSGVGNFGQQLGADVATTSCSVGAYERGMAQMAQAERGETFLQQGAMAYNYQRAAGNRRM